MKSGPNHAPNDNRTRRSEYGIWIGMIARCRNPNSTGWENYGGRGISVHAGWVGRGGFEAFIEHVGPRPSMKHSLDRIDNDGHYEPGNVRWVTVDIQLANRRAPRERRRMRARQEPHLALLASQPYRLMDREARRDLDRNARAQMSILDDLETIDPDRYPDQCFGDIQFAPEALRR